MRRTPEIDRGREEPQGCVLFSKTDLSQIMKEYLTNVRRFLSRAVKAIVSKVSRGVRKTDVLLIAIAFGGSIAVHVVLHVPLGIALAIFFVVWPLFGTLVTIDDDLPGGFSNADGSERPEWLESPFWGRIMAGASISAVGCAVDFGWNSGAALRFWILAAGGGFLAIALMTRK
jgi:hypothetical protein